MDKKFRRSNKDLEWVKVKNEVKKRDRSDKLIQVISLKELLILKKYGDKKLLKVLDVSHVFPVSLYPHLVYDIDNLVLLNRWSHMNLDSMRCPLTGVPIDREKRDYWWKRLIGEKKFNKLRERIEY